MNGPREVFIFRSLSGYLFQEYKGNGSDDNYYAYPCRIEAPLTNISVFSPYSKGKKNSSPLQRSAG
jgi:hypothetical protein